MTRFKAFRSTVCAALCLLGVSSASATLFDRGGGLIYDDKLNITWLQDANYARTSGFDPDGLMTWTAANTWAAGLSYFDSVRNVAWTDWRLPYASVSAGAGPISSLAIGQPCTGESACRDNEMAYMFYFNLDGTFWVPETGTQVGDGVTLNNIQGVYWSGTVLDSTYAWNFHFQEGYQDRGDRRLTGGFGFRPSQVSAWAVRPGDVAAPIPEPETYAMLLAGLGLLGFHARRRKMKEAAAT